MYSDTEQFIFTYNDGGRAKAGFKGTTGDCVTRAVAIALDRDYREVYDDLSRLQKEFVENTRSKKINKKYTTARKGVYREVYQKYLEDNGFRWVPTMKIGQGCTVHLKPAELPAETLICRVSKHLTTVKDGVIQDIHNPSRGGTRCVYGYFERVKDQSHEQK